MLWFPRSPSESRLGIRQPVRLAGHRSKYEGLLAKQRLTALPRCARLAAVELAGKRILLSGATGGLGRAIAAELAGEGARLVLSSRKPAQLEELAKSLPGGAGRHATVVADLARPGAAEELIAEAGDLDGLVANAGMSGTGRLERFSQREVRDVLRVNLEAPIAMARDLIGPLSAKGEGHIVMICSLNAKAATPRTSLYCATKFGLRGFALALREDLLPAGIGVSIVSPGFVREAGMFHEAGVKAPPVLGTTTPRKVGRGVVRAIRRNLAELEIAPRRQRAATAIAHRRPQLAARIQRRGGADKIAERLAAGHTGGKR